MLYNRFPSIINFLQRMAKQSSLARKPHAFLTHDTKHAYMIEGVLSTLACIICNLLPCCYFLGLLQFLERELIGSPGKQLFQWNGRPTDGTAFNNGMGTFVHSFFFISLINCMQHPEFIKLLQNLFWRQRLLLLNATIFLPSTILCP